MRKGFLLNKARHAQGRAAVYSLHIKDSKNDVFKVGFSTNFSVRLSYYPDRLDIDVLKVMMLPKTEALALEKFIHANCKDKAIWRGRSFSGSKRELYTKEVNINDWYRLYKDRLPEEKEDIKCTKEDLNNYLTL